MTAASVFEANLPVQCHAQVHSGGWAQIGVLSKSTISSVRHDCHVSDDDNDIVSKLFEDFD